MNKTFYDSPNIGIKHLFFQRAAIQPVYDLVQLDSVPLVLLPHLLGSEVDEVEEYNRNLKLGNNALLK